VESIKNLEQLPAAAAKKIAPYLREMLALHGDRIRAVFIYGSATGHNFIPAISDINSLFIFDYLDFTVFKKSLKTVAWGKKQNIAAPLFLTQEYMKSTVDVFPIEFRDIKENYRLVYGEDVLASLEIKGEHIRLFCEQQIKGKLVRLREAYLEVGLKSKELESVIRGSYRDLLPVFRSLIRLKGKKPSYEKENIIKQLCAEFQLDENVFLLIHTHIIQGRTIRGYPFESFLESYLEQLKKLASQVDQL